MAVKNAATLLSDFCEAGIAVEVTHRAKRRLYGLANLAPLRETVAPPRRPEPGRGRGRPPIIDGDPEEALPLPLPPLPLTPLERRAFDYSELEHAMAVADDAIRRARHNLLPAAPPRTAPERLPCHYVANRFAAG
jgi:hypothetical protein